MKLKLKKLKNEQIDLFNKSEEESFNIHNIYFENGIVPGASEDDRGEYDLVNVMNNPKFTVLSICDDDKFIGGAIVEEIDNNIIDIGIFFLIVEYQSKGIGREALELVENYFPSAQTFRLITPSQVIRNCVFYINKCGYKIVKVVDYDRKTNTADYVFEKKKGEK